MASGLASEKQVPLSVRAGLWAVDFTQVATDRLGFAHRGTWQEVGVPLSMEKVLSLL